MSNLFWASGPGEILKHGVSLLKTDTDTNRRLAMISIDNSVELIMQTFLNLPTRITGISLSRKDRAAYCENFPAMLDGIEATAADKITGLNLGEIEWFHRLRNELYHQGNGLTVERLKVEAYAEIASRLFECLFDERVELQESASMDKMRIFLDDWIRLEVAIRDQMEHHYASPLLAFHELKDRGKIDTSDFARLQEMQKVRNQLVHGQKAPDRLLSEHLLKEMKELADKIQ